MEKMQVNWLVEAKNNERQLFVVCSMPHQNASASQGQISSDNCMCCHTEIDFADQTFFIILSIPTQG